MGGANLTIQFCESLTQLLEGGFLFDNPGGMILKVVPDVFGFLANSLQLDIDGVEFMTCKLGFQFTQFVHDLLVTTSLAGLALERTDLAFDLANGVFQTQEVLFGVIEFAQGLFFLLFKLGDAGCFLKHHAAFRRLALNDVRNLALGHDAVAVSADAGAHE